MKKNYSGGSNEMYADHDKMQYVPRPKELKIANSRGKKPVINDIKKAWRLLSDVRVEINPCEGYDDINKCTSILFKLLQQNS